MWSVVNRGLSEEEAKLAFEKLGGFVLALLRSSCQMTPFVFIDRSRAVTTCDSGYDERERIETPSSSSGAGTPDLLSMLQRVVITLERKCLDA